MYQVVAFTDEGIEVSEFERFELAEREAEEWREAGTRACLCEVLDVFDPGETGCRYLTPADRAEEYGLRPGHDFPGSLGWGE